MGQKPGNRDKTQDGLMIHYLREHPGARTRRIASDVNLPATVVSRILRALEAEGATRRFFQFNQWYLVEDTPDTPYLIQTFLGKRSVSTFELYRFLTRYKVLPGVDPNSEMRRTFRLLAYLTDKKVVRPEYQRKLNATNNAISWWAVPETPVPEKTPFWEQLFETDEFPAKYTAQITHLHVDEVMRFLEWNPGATSRDVSCLHPLLVQPNLQDSMLVKWAYRILKDLRREGQVRTFGSQNRPQWELAGEAREIAPPKEALEGEATAPTAPMELPKQTFNVPWGNGTHNTEVYFPPTILIPFIQICEKRKYNPHKIINSILRKYLAEVFASEWGNSETREGGENS